MFASISLNALVRNLKYFIPAIIWGLIILYLSSGPGVQLPMTFDISIDKLGHFVFYGILAFLITLGLQKKESVISENTLFKSFIVSSLYGISGDVTIVSDCEIRISNFFYNGAGPNVSFYGGINGDFRGGINMSERLNGRSWQGETLNLFLPEGFSFEEINSFSVWCFEFDVDFSSASFR